MTVSLRSTNPIEVRIVSFLLLTMNEGLQSTRVRHLTPTAAAWSIQKNRELLIEENCGLRTRIKTQHLEPQNKT